jgi:hypothetical protein
MRAGFLFDFSKKIQRLPIINAKLQLTSKLCTGYMNTDGAITPSV